MADNKSDYELLRGYVAGDSAAFSELVRRHGDLIYSAALRQTRDAHLAEDVTQAVFMILMKKARKCGRGIVLSAWLYRAARFAARDAMKRDRRRRYHESQAGTTAARSEQMAPVEDTWAKIAPALDDAVASLGERDQTAVLLRFFENRNLCHVGDALGTSEAAAGQRVIRAVRRLRVYLWRRGVTTSADALSAAIVANAVAPAPPALRIISGSASAATNAGKIAERAMRAMFWTKPQILAVCASVLILAIAVPTLVVAVESRDGSQPPPSRGAASATQQAIARARELAPSPEYPLTRWAHSWEWNQFVAMKIDVESTVSGSRKGAVNEGYVHKLFEWHRDHDRMEALGKEWERNYARVLGSNPFVEILTHDQYLRAGMGGATSLYQPEWNGQLYTKSLDDLRQHWETNLDYAYFLDEKEFGSETELFPEAMLKNRPRVAEQMEVVNDRQCYRVEASSPQGNLTAWIDPASACTAARYSIDESAQQTLRGHTLTSLGIDHWTLQVDVDHVKKFGDFYVATAGRFNQVTWWHTGVKQTTSVVASRSEIDLSPDFGKMQAFTLNVPDGTRIYYDKAPGIPYEIRGRQLEPHVDQKELSELEHVLDGSDAGGAISVPATGPSTMPGSQ